LCFRGWNFGNSFNTFPLRLTPFSFPPEEKKLRSWEAGKLRKGKDRSEEDENCTTGRMGSPKIPLDFFIDLDLLF
jgi:hypothetical protein